MLNKILLVIILGFFAGLAPAEAQTPATGAPRVKGRIIAARVQGHVEVISKADGQKRVLHDGDALSEQTEIVTAQGADVVLVFSNGATVNVAADSTLDIDQFDQDPFASELKVSEMTAEPGTSTTRLSLTKGEIVGKVVHLNVDKGSEFTIQTPVGAAGIRGTTFRIVFRPTADGKAFFVVTTADGTVVFKGVTAAPVSIPAGKEIVATIDTSPAALATLGVLLTTNTTPEDAATIQAAAQVITGAAATTTISSPPQGNTPPVPAPAPPQTTPGAGG